MTRRIDYVTYESGLFTGQTQTITTSKRSLSTVTAVLSEIVTRAVAWNKLRREVTAYVDTAQTNLGRGWGDTYRQWDGDKAGTSAAAVGSGGASMGGPSAPENSVQLYIDGSFGSDPYHTFDPDTNCLIAGHLSTITAALPESCQALGYDCHIADP